MTDPASISTPPASFGAALAASSCGVTAELVSGEPSPCPFPSEESEEVQLVAIAKSGARAAAKESATAVAARDVRLDVSSFMGAERNLDWFRLLSCLPMARAREPIVLTS